MERFNHKKLNNVKAKEQYQAKIWNRVAASENLDNDVDLNKFCESKGKDVPVFNKVTPHEEVLYT
jgi:hypothetical protein